MMSTAKMQESISLVLTIGTLISLILVTVGGILYLIQFGNEPLQNELIGVDVYQRHVTQLVCAAVSCSPLAIVEMGLLILVFTQILRVALLCYFYVVMHDYWFTVISFFILIVLIYGFIFRH